MAVGMIGGMAGVMARGMAGVMAGVTAGGMAGVTAGVRAGEGALAVPLSPRTHWWLLSTGGRGIIFLIGAVTGGYPCVSK